MEEEKEKKELMFRFGAYWDQRCVPLCDVCYTPLVPEDSGDNYAYCVRCGDSKKLCDYTREMLTIKETITLVKAEKEIMGEEMEEEKEIFPRYGVYWRKKGEHYEALCPECKKALNIFGGKKQVSLTNLFCPECKKVRPLYSGNGTPITIHKATELMLSGKPEVKPETEEEDWSSNYPRCKKCKIAFIPEDEDDRYCKTCVNPIMARNDKYGVDGEPIEEKITISNRYIIHSLTDISCKVDAIKARLDKVVAKQNDLYDMIEYNETFILDKLNKILRKLGEKKE